MLNQHSCGMTPAEVAAEEAEAQRETDVLAAKQEAEREAWIAALPTKDQRYFQRNKVQRTYEAALVRAEKLGAVPAWLTEDDKKQVFKVYEAAEALHKATGIPHEVDHIVPLVGKNKAGDKVICGLHVASNLRAIPWSLNRMRGNWYFIADMEDDEANQKDTRLYGFEEHNGEEDDRPW